MYDWLKHYDIRTCIVVTKADKIPKSQWDKQIKLVKETLQADPRDTIIRYSSETGEGRDQLWNHIVETIGE
jgi:GTP-binding protein